MSHHEPVPVKGVVNLTEPPQTPGPVVPPNVYQCIANVTREIAKVGIGKTSVNAQQGYKFRGIDAVANTLAPILAEQGLVILPRVLRREMTERATAKGGVLFSVIEEVEFTFISAHDGSQHVCTNYGEGMDSADKATNKALTAAYKYLVNIAFCIPTEAANDADSTTPEPVAAAPKGFADWFDDLTAVTQSGVTALRAAWNQSKKEYRDYLTTTEPATWEKLKRIATDITAKESVQ